MVSSEDLINTFIEEYEGGINEFENKRYKNSLILLSKSIFALCDYLILNELNILPKNHGERFRILENKFLNVYHIVDELWNNYVDAYSKPVTSELVKKIKIGVKEIIKNGKYPQEIKKIIE